MTSLLVESPGFLTTVQDFGRPGHGVLGVSASGAADTIALQLGNRLVGNPPGAAALEMTLTGNPIKISGMPVHPKFSFPGDDAARIARTALGLNPEKFTVFLNAGWEGGGNIPHIFSELVRGELDVQAIFLAGKNEGLKNEANFLVA